MQKDDIQSIDSAEDNLFLQLFTDKVQINKIDCLSTNLIRNMSVNFRQTQLETLSLKQAQSMNFDEQLNLNVIIQKLLEVLEITKVGILELEDPNMILQTEVTQQFKNKFSIDLKKYLKTLYLREAQIGSLLYLKQKRNEDNFVEQYLQTYGEIKDYIISVDNIHDEINIFVLEDAIQMEIGFLEEYRDMISLMKLNIVHKKYLANMSSLVKTANRLKVINSKIVTIAEIFPYACILDKDDLFSFSKTHKRWRDLLGTSIKHKFYGEAHKVRESFDKLKSGLNFVNAAMSLFHQSKEHWGKQHWQRKDWYKVWEISGKMMKIAIFPKNATQEAELLISEPDSKLAKQIWNLPEEKNLRSLINSILPSIAFSQELMIPRVFTQYLEEANILEDSPSIPELQIEDIKDYALKMLEISQKENKLPMRINCPYPLKLKGTVENIGYFSMFQSMFKKKPKMPMAVIYHIHGGGFISMSSFIHQTYTRIWATNLDVPIISIDYGKAPENPYPQGLNDCFQGYMWTLYQFRQIYEMEPVKIILVGDSAGGNLVAALTNMLIKYNLRIPDGLVMVYPALNLNFKNYTPSLLTSLNDMILPHTFLKICLESYIQSDKLKPGSDPFLSPMMADDETLKKYPPTRMFVGSRDPFHDDCCRFTEKLNLLKPDIAKLLIFEEFPHGFLQFDIKTQPHQDCKKATKQVEKALEQLLALN